MHLDFPLHCSWRAGFLHRPKRAIKPLPEAFILEERRKLMDAAIALTGSNTQSLSDLSASMGFVRADTNAAQDEQMIKSPLEENREKVNSFAKYSTGAMPVEIPQEILVTCERLREIQVTTELLRISKLIAQVQASFESSGVPSRIVNPAVIADIYPTVQTVDDFSDQLLEASSVPVEILDGYACVNGIPIWERLGSERIDFYNVFKLYRDSRYRLLEDGTYIITNRTLAGLARELKLPAGLLAYISKIHCWSTRIRCYDMYMEALIQRQKAIEVAQVQCDHQRISKKLYDKAEKYLEKNFDALQPKDVVDILELAFKYSRVSVGLLGDKPGSTSGAQTNYSFVSTTNNNADKMIQVNTPDLSPAMSKLQEDMKQEDNLLSIIHVLQASGAMKTAIHGDLVANGEKGLDIIDDEEVVN